MALCTTPPVSCLALVLLREMAIEDKTPRRKTPLIAINFILFIIMIIFLVIVLFLVMVLFIAEINAIDSSLPTFPVALFYTQPTGPYCESAKPRNLRNYARFSV